MAWSGAWKLGASIWQNALAMQDTMIASHTVIRHRSGIIGAALNDPAGADLAELSKMWTEKVVAFTDAGASLVNDCLSLQGDWIAQGADLMALMISGLLPAARMKRVQNRATQIVADASLAGGRALAPIRRTARRNQRRLSRTRRKN